MLLLRIFVDIPVEISNRNWLQFKKATYSGWGVEKSAPHFLRIPHKPFLSVSGGVLFLIRIYTPKAFKAILRLLWAYISVNKKGAAEMNRTAPLNYSMLVCDCLQVIFSKFLVR